MGRARVRFVMKINKSEHLGVFVKNVDEAQQYYESLFGFKLISKETKKIVLKNGHQFFYIIQNNSERGTVIEFEVENIEKAKSIFQNQDCEILKWDGKDGDCFVRDKYGMVFNLWQKENKLNIESDE